MELTRTAGEGSNEMSDGVQEVYERSASDPRQQAQMEILEAVERGELSPQEAIDRLDELEE